MNYPYVEPSLRLGGVNASAPNLDAAAYYGDRIAQAEAIAKAIAQDVTAARGAADDIKAIAEIDFTPAVAAQLAAVLAGRVGKASWSHFEGVEDILASLDSAVDGLGAV